MRCSSPISTSWRGAPNAEGGGARKRGESGLDLRPLDIHAVGYSTSHLSARRLLGPPPCSILESSRTGRQEQPNREVFTKVSKSDKPAKIFRPGAKSLNVSPVDEDTEGHSFRQGSSSAKGLQSSARGLQSSARGLQASGDDDTEGHSRGLQSSAKGLQSSARGLQSSARGLQSSAKGLQASDDDDTEGHSHRFLGKKKK